MEYTIDFEEGPRQEDAGEIKVLGFDLKGNRERELDPELLKAEIEDGREEISRITFSAEDDSLFAVIGTKPVSSEIRLVETSFTDPSMPEVSISGMLPEGGSVTVKDVDEEELRRLEAQLRKEIRLRNPGVFFVAESACDIEIYDEEGNLFEPEAYDQTVTVSVEKEDIKEGTELLVAHEAVEGGFDEPVRVEVESGKIEYEADHFSKSINGVEYYEFSGLTVRLVSEYAYVGGTFDVSVDFLMEELNHANFYGEIPYDEELVDYSEAKGTVTLDGEEAGTYQVIVEDGKAYLCVSLYPDHASGSAGEGGFSLAVKAKGEGELNYEGFIITIKDPDEEKYDDVAITKSVESYGHVTDGEHKGDFYVTYRIVLTNAGTESVEGLRVYDIPENLNPENGAAPFVYWAEENGSYVRRTAGLYYPDTIPGDGNDYAMIPGSGPEFSDEAARQNYFSVSDVSLGGGEDLSGNIPFISLKKKLR